MTYVETFQNVNQELRKQQAAQTLAGLLKQGRLAKSAPRKRNSSLAKELAGLLKKSKLTRKAPASGV